jgi:rare lipoprotein A
MIKFYLLLLSFLMLLMNVQCVHTPQREKRVIWNSGEPYVEQGAASWYGRPFHGRKTASGERYNMNHMTCAHKTLPLGAMIRVTHRANNKSLTLRVNDRGPFVGQRILDVSRAAAEALGFKSAGIGRVRIEWLAQEGSPVSVPSVEEQIINDMEKADDSDTE